MNGLGKHRIAQVIFACLALLALAAVGVSKRS